MPLQVLVYLPVDELYQRSQFIANGVGVWGIRDGSDVGTEIRELRPIHFIVKQCAESPVAYPHGLPDGITAAVCDRGLYELYERCWQGVPIIVDHVSQVATEGSPRRLGTDKVQESRVVHMQVVSVGGDVQVLEGVIIVYDQITDEILQVYQGNVISHKLLQCSSKALCIYAQDIPSLHQADELWDGITTGINACIFGTHCPDICI